MNDNDTPVNRKSDAELNTDIKLKSKIQADPRIKTKPFNIIPQLLEKQTWSAGNDEDGMSDGNSSQVDLRDYEIQQLRTRVE